MTKLKQDVVFFVQRNLQYYRVTTHLPIIAMIQFITKMVVSVVFLHRKLEAIKI